MQVLTIGVDNLVDDIAVFAEPEDQLPQHIHSVAIMRSSFYIKSYRGNEHRKITRN